MPPYALQINWRYIELRCTLDRQQFGKNPSDGLSILCIVIKHCIICVDFFLFLNTQVVEVVAHLEEEVCPSLAGKLIWVVQVSIT